MIILDNISLLIQRIISGKLYFQYDDIWYVLTYPSIDIKYESELLYEQILSNNKFDDWWRKDNLNYILSNLGLWTKDDDKLIDKTNKSIESSKLNLYLNRSNTNKLKNIRKDLENYKQDLNKLLNRKYSLDYLTLEDFAYNKKNEFILINCLSYKDSKVKVFNNEPDTINYSFFDKLVSNINEHSIDIDTYKKIARHESWKMIWYANKNNIFNKSACELTDEQKTLISISHMYDKIYEHPECPEESVINDNDMLDGWMIEQKRKNEALKKENNGSSLTQKHNKATEIFVVGEKEEVEDIINMNSVHSQQIIKQRSRLIKNQKNGIDEIDLPDVKQELLQKLNTRKF